MITDLCDASCKNKQNKEKVSTRCRAAGRRDALQDGDAGEGRLCDGTAALTDSGRRYTDEKKINVCPSDTDEMFSVFVCCGQKLVIFCDAATDTQTSELLRRFVSLWCFLIGRLKCFGFREVNKIIRMKHEHRERGETMSNTETGAVIQQIFLWGKNKSHWSSLTSARQTITFWEQISSLINVTSLITANSI